jgi:Holliday junction resolvasome RuvABC endonuclease subunit
MATFLALDVALAFTGYAVVTDSMKVITYGVIKTSPKSKTSFKYVQQAQVSRCQSLAESVLSIIRSNPIEVVVAEFPAGGGRSFSAVSAMALATGTVAAAITSVGLPVIVVHPNQSKRLFSAKGAVSKDSLSGIVVPRFKFEVAPVKISEHVSDALAAFLVASQIELKDYG